jgi:molybdopterin-biosynthesis enzyme MoeA-like protein
MAKLLTLLAITAVLAAVLISGCTQSPSIPSGGTGGTIDKATEDKAAAALESELEQAVANMTEADIEQALLNQ